ncbi:MAG TPA: methyl-accepting chemotaxis protein [Xanthobacteraceae bacterium]|nr:methyl-accepting chemotaxis protein [Xanthobacteraceae bacterium]
MLARVSVNLLLKSVIASLAAAVVVVLALSAWGSWTRLAAVNRIAASAEASAYLFTSLHNLRVDRSTTNRELLGERVSSSLPPILKGTRDAEMPALKASLVALQATQFPEREAMAARLDQAIKKLIALHQETQAAIARPKASRPPGLAKEFMAETNTLMQLLDDLQVHLTKSVKLEDSYVDQLLNLKELAWVARNAGGDAAVMLSNAIGGQPLPADPMQKYMSHVTRLDTAWNAIQTFAAGLPLPPKFAEAVDKAKREFLAPDYSELRLKTLKTLIDGQRVDFKVDDWSKMSVAKLASLLGVAEVALDVAKEHAAAQHEDALWKLTLQLVLLAVAVVVALGMMVVISRRVTGPLRQLQQAMLKVATGDFSVALPGLDRKDEIGDVANAVERFKVLAEDKAREQAEEAARRQKEEAERHAEVAKAEADRRAQAAAAESARQAEISRLEAERQAAAAEAQARAADEQDRIVRLLAEGLRRLAEGDLTFRLGDGFTDAYMQIRDDFNAAIAQLQETIGAIAASTREVTNASAEIATSTTDLSQRTEEQAATLEQTSASMEEISVTVRKNAENARHANQLTIGTRDVADRGGAVVASAVEAMSRIEDSSRKIADIIGVIDEIARQTNLLALNAAVEAARAGDAGRGFAVVASEVRSLAQRSSQAAKDIKDLITNSSVQVKDGVELVNRAGKSLSEIVESIKSVADIVGDIATASSEQATGLEQVNKALAQMDEVTQQNSALVEENAATAKTLEQQAIAMNERVSTFRLMDAPAQAARQRAA